MISSLFKAEMRTYRRLSGKVPSLALTVFILSVILMNLLANKELFRTSWVALDCGFILSWIPFLLMDCFCKVYGGRDAVRISVLAIVINLLIFGIFKLISLTPGMWGAYYDSGMQEVNDALNSTIGGSTWIVLGSALAMILSSIANATVNILIGKVLHKDRYQEFALRSVASTAVAQIVDNMTFALVVSVPLFGWTFSQAFFCSITAATFELLAEAAFTGVGWRVVRNWTE